MTTKFLDIFYYFHCITHTIHILDESARRSAAGTSGASSSGATPGKGGRAKKSSVLSGKEDPRPKKKVKSPERVFQTIPDPTKAAVPTLGKAIGGSFKIPTISIPGTSGASGLSITKATSSKSRPPPALTPAPQLRRTESTNPLPPFPGGGMMRPTLDPNLHRQVLSRAEATVTQEKSQNPRNQSNPTLAGFSSDVVYVDSPQKGEKEKPKSTSKKSKTSQTSQRKSATTVICPPNPFQKPNPYEYDDSNSSAASYKRLSPETSRSPVRFKVPSRPDSPTDEYSDDRYHYPERHPELLRSASQTSGEYSEDNSDSDHDRESTDDTVSNDDNEEEVFTQEYDIPPTPQVHYRHNPLPGGRSRRPIALPAQQKITPCRDEDGTIDYGSLDLKRRICDYDAPPR